jgi:hypothetical protein
MILSSEISELPNIERDMRLNVMCRVLVGCGDVPAAEMEEAKAAGVRIGEA